MLHLWCAFSFVSAPNNELGLKEQNQDTVDPSVTTVDSDAKYGKDSKREEHSHKFGDYYLPLLRYVLRYVLSTYLQ
ncbi:hypothetical protein CMV_015804 [Castanea mollissima]|uniref:Uncharacterized protein n=1 Tax=Castanea mollissima TaxID=60419 RepID=A0A8J4QTY1_9ROSI|nr:hypothetical protein CMV_015804 [Castanea mollissima]